MSFRRKKTKCPNFSHEVWGHETHLHSFILYKTCLQYYLFYKSQIVTQVKTKSCEIIIHKKDSIKY
jgi:hypothetical protein